MLGDAVLNHRCAQAQDESGVWNRYGGRMAWDARAIVGDDPNFRGRGNRSSGDIFAAAPNIDHSQVRGGRGMGGKGLSCIAGYIIGVITI